MSPMTDPAQQEDRESLDDIFHMQMVKVINLTSNSHNEKITAQNFQQEVQHWAAGYTVLLLGLKNKHQKDHRSEKQSQSFWK